MAGVSGASQGGVYTAPYYIQVDGGAPQIAMCIDFHHETYFDQTWQANVSTFNGPLTHTRLGAGGFAQYRATAWLLDQLLRGNGSSGDINFAAWALLSPDVVGKSGWTSGAAYWLDRATNDDLSYFDDQLANFRLVTPEELNAASPQEFVTQVPEPASFWLLATGALWPMRRWRRR
jgi:hypothetical protein